MKNEEPIRWVKPTPKGYDLDYKNLKCLSEKEAEELFNEKPKVKSKKDSEKKRRQL